MSEFRTPLVELHNVSYQAGGQLLLDRVNWRLEHGKSWAVLGPNGAGKTLLLRMIAGHLWPNAGGEIRRQGKRLLELMQSSGFAAPDRALLKRTAKTYDAAAEKKNDEKKDEKTPVNKR